MNLGFAGTLHVKFDVEMETIENPKIEIDLDGDPLDFSLVTFGPDYLLIELNYKN